MKKALCLLLIIALFSLSGCVEIEKPSIAEINGEAVSIDEYKVFLSSMEIPASMQYSDEDWETEKDGKTTYELMKETAYNDMLQVYVIAAKAKAEGIVCEYQEGASAKQTLIQSTGLSESEFIKQAGITSEALNAAAGKLALYYRYISELQTSSKLNFTEEEINAKYNEGFFRAKHILVSTLDEEGKPLEGDALKEKKALAEEILGKATPANFDSLVDEYSEDPGSATNPDGYVFTEGEMVAEFEDATKALTIGGISGIVETSYGYHIILRLELPTNPEDENYMNAMSSVQNELIYEAISKMAEELKSELTIVEYTEEIDSLKR